MIVVTSVKQRNLKRAHSQLVKRVVTKIERPKQPVAVSIRQDRRQRVREGREEGHISFTKEEALPRKVLG